MKRWIRTIAPFLVFFMIVAGWLVKRAVTSPQPTADALCALKADAPQEAFQAFLQGCTAHKSSHRESVHQFIACKKEAAIQAVQKEWEIEETQLHKLMQRTEHYQAHMKGDSKEGHLISCPTKRYAQVKENISDILTTNGITNVSIRVVTDRRVMCPAIYFCDEEDPYFMVTVPRGFEQMPADLQKGDLEHELTHLSCCHPVVVNDVCNYIAEREGIDHGVILNSLSFQKWMRAYEYEADLLPSLKNPATAEHVLCALNDIKVTDEVHPPTRKRQKMVMRVKRLGELSSI